MGLHKNSTHVYFMGDSQVGTPLLESLMRNSIDRIEYLGRDGRMRKLRRPVIMVWNAQVTEQLGQLARDLVRRLDYLEKRKVKHGKRKRQGGKGRRGADSGDSPTG